MSALAATTAHAKPSAAPAPRIAAPDCAAEREADRIADTVIRGVPVPEAVTAPGFPPPLYRSCAACSGAGPPCAACAAQEEEPRLLLLKRTAGATVPAAADVAARAVSSGGRPLPGGVRSYFEPRFGTDLSGVRIHTDTESGRAALAIGARAYALGSDIGFAPGQFRPDTPGGRRLLAHELAHVAGARADAGTLHRGFFDNPAEAALDLAVRQVTRQLSGGGLPGFPDFLTQAVGFAVAGFLTESYSRLISDGEFLEILGRLRELQSPVDVLSFIASYNWGLLQGLVSPVTGLYHLAEGALSLQMMAVQWLAQLPAQAPTLQQDGEALSQELALAVANVQDKVRQLRVPDNAAQFALEVFAALAQAADSARQAILSAAEGAGREAAGKVIDHFQTAPLPQLGEEVGELIGMAFIEIVLLATTGSVGNLIADLGRFARTLRVVRSGERIAVAAERIGGVLVAIEDTLAALLNATVLRPFRPIFEALAPLIARFRAFLRRLMGFQDEALATAARTAQAAVPEPDVPAPAPRPAEPAPPTRPQPAHPETAEPPRRRPPRSPRADDTARPPAERPTEGAATPRPRSETPTREPAIETDLGRRTFGARGNRLTICRNPCDHLVEKLESMRGVVPPGHRAREELDYLAAIARKTEADLAVGRITRGEAETKAAELARLMEGVQDAFPELRALAGIDEAAIRARYDALRARYANELPAAPRSTAIDPAVDEAVERAFADDAEFLHGPAPSPSRPGVFTRESVRLAREAGRIDARGQPIGPIDAAIAPHARAGDIRQELGAVGTGLQSGHGAASNFVRDLENHLGVRVYDREAAETFMLERTVHNQEFDRHWKIWTYLERQRIRASGSTDFRASLRDVLNAHREAVRQIPSLPEGTRATMEWIIEREFREIARQIPGGMDTLVPLPVGIRP